MEASDSPISTLPTSSIKMDPVEHASVTIEPQQLARPLLPWKTEEIGRIFLGISACLYLLGLLTVNAYLLNRGVAEYSLIRIRFILTGILALVPFIWFDGVLIVSLRWVLKRTNETPKVPIYNPFQWKLQPRTTSQKWKDFLVIIFLNFLGFMIFWVALTFADSSAVGTIVGMMCISIVVGCCLCFYHFGQSEYKKSVATNAEVGITSNRTARTFFAVVTLGVFYIYARVFASTIFPIISQSWGGGLPVPIKLILSSKEIKPLSTIALNFDTASGISDRVDLLFDGDDHFVVGLHNLVDDSVSNVVVLDKKCVLGYKVIHSSKLLAHAVPDQWKNNLWLKEARKKYDSLNIRLKGDVAQFHFDPSAGTDFNNTIRIRDSLEDAWP
jgi:hypothetical protein